jgi:glycosyltransferase involved in cell wall biosynthesis
MQRHLAVQGTRAARAYGALEVRKVRRWERVACTRVTGVLTCSEHDRAILQALAPRARLFVVPNVVDTGHYAPGGTPERRTVVFQGGMEWHPNRDAVEFFATSILPPLRARVPDVEFRVAGRCSDERFRRRWERAGVSFTGWVPEMRDEIARAAVCVIPLRVGSGTRLKILEAGAMGKAMVSTTLGAEGLDLVDGEEICLADEPTAFARAVADLLGDEVRRLSLGRAARLRVEKDYSLPALQAALREALAAVRR